jgi:hypothetical protein
VVKTLHSLVWDTRARTTGISCFPCRIPTPLPPFISPVLRASRLLLRAILGTCRLASELELELGLKNPMAQKQMLRAGAYARALRVS